VAHGGPWEPDPQAPRGRFKLWLCLMGLLALAILALVRAFPEAIRTRDDWAAVAYGVGFMVLLSGGVFRLRSGQLIQHLRHLAIWAGLVAIFVVGFAYRDLFADAGQRLRLAFSTGAPVSVGEHEIAIPRDESGAYLVVGAVNGQRVRFMVDTGATDIVLSPDDARRAGVDVDALRFDRQAETANGLGYGAVHRIRQLEIGPVRLTDVDVTVNQSPMSVSLLGMSFLHRLESFEFRGGKLVMRWRGAP
jgi:aspartyl protease family protein